MQSVSQQFKDKAKANNRSVSASSLVDWENAENYQDESGNMVIFETDRRITEPLGGTHKGQFDISLNNKDNRYTPGGESPIEPYLIRGRRFKGYVSFNGENLQVGKGKSEVPRIDIGRGKIKVKFFDETATIHEHKLPNGNQLYTDIRTDRYVWLILDEVYSGHYTTITSFDSTETWVGGTADTVNARVGDRALRLNPLNGAEVVAYRQLGSPLNLSAYGADDYLSMFIYIDDITNLENLDVRLYSVVNESWFEIHLEYEDLVTGWNQIWVPFSDLQDFIATQGSQFQIGVSAIQGPHVIAPSAASMSNINRIEVRAKAYAGYNLIAIVDELRACDGVEYPQRYFDIGLQTIPVAEFGGNTGLFEIKTACEAEGARFYADEQGCLHFENRQFYNLNDDYKKSVAEFSFNRMTDFVHPQSEQGLINRVKVSLNPRVIQSTKEIWRYGFVAEIAAGQTKTIYASFSNPCPTTVTGIVQPVATTDYTANTQSGGGGTDKTAQVAITLTRFTNSAKLDVKNNDTGTVYITLLKLRGTPAEPSNETYITAEDSTSIFEYGEQPAGGYSITNKYMNNETFAANLAQTVVDNYKDPLSRITLTARAKPELQIGDMISVKNDYVDATQLMRITGIGITVSSDEGMNQKIECRSVTPFETLTYFHIGTSAIESTDVIAP